MFKSYSGSFDLIKCVELNSENKISYKNQIFINSNIKLNFNRNKINSNEVYELNLIPVENYTLFKIG